MMTMLSQSHGWLLVGGAISWLLILAAAVFFVFWIVKRAPAARTQTGLELLRWRYAKGEITKKQFDTMKKDIVA